MRTTGADRTCVPNRASRRRLGDSADRDSPLATRPTFDRAEDPEATPLAYDVYVGFDHHPTDADAAAVGRTGGRVTWRSSRQA